MKNEKQMKILVPIDFSEISDLALSEAVVLMKSLDAKLTIMHVLKSHILEFAVFPEVHTTELSLDDQEVVKENMKNEILEKAKLNYGIIPDVYIAIGNIAREIIDYTSRKKYDLIVMGTHGASGYKELFIGSNAQHVVAESEIPVLTINKKKNYTGFMNILIPIDNSTHSREKVNMALLIAESFNSQIHLVGLTDTKDELELDKFNIKLESIENVIEADGLTYDAEIVYGNNLAKTALHLAEEKHCDLIIINSGHESRMNNYLLNTFSHQIVNHANVSVLSIKHKESHFSIETPGYGI